MDLEIAALSDKQVSGGVDRDARRKNELRLHRRSTVAAVQQITAPGAVTGDARDDARWAVFSDLAVVRIGSIGVTPTICGETTRHRGLFLRGLVRRLHTRVATGVTERERNESDANNAREPYGEGSCGFAPAQTCQRVPMSVASHFPLIRSATHKRGVKNMSESQGTSRRLAGQ